jgi:REP element-mobilizing transposase RayT
MVHGYHVIMGLYGFWLPNDPRGSWSEFVGAWELLRFGQTTRRHDRTAYITPEERRQREAAKAALKYPPVELTGRQARAVGRGFASFCEKRRLAVWACSILPEHVHLVIARFRYEVEKVANLLKGAATRQLRNEGLDPMQGCHTRRGQTRSSWARGQWNVYLDTEEAICNAIRYVEQNPMKEGKPPQRWSFVTAFGGLEAGGAISYPG